MPYHWQRGAFRAKPVTYYGVRVVRTRDALEGADWLMTTGWTPILFRTREAAQEQARVCAKHTRSPYITYYVDEYNQ